MVNNVLASGVQQSDSVIHISILFQILLPFRLLQSIQQSSLCYTVGPVGHHFIFYFYFFGYHFKHSSVYISIPNILNLIYLLSCHFKSVLEVNRKYILPMITYYLEKYSLGTVPDTQKQVSCLRFLFS